MWKIFHNIYLISILTAFQFSVRRPLYFFHFSLLKLSSLLQGSFLHSRMEMSVSLKGAYCFLIFLTGLSFTRSAQDEEAASLLSPKRTEVVVAVLIFQSHAVGYTQHRKQLWS
jgi:hypothetical protein